MNEDVEVVHYAITAMVELSKEYDFCLQKMEKLYAASPDDPESWSSTVILWKSI